MADILKTVADVIAPYLEKCFKKQFNYLCCMKANIQYLKDAAKDLDDKGADLHERVDGAKRNGERILPEVETWFTKADETQSNKCQIIDTPIPRILNLKARYSLSRNAKKTTESMVELRDTCKFDRVSNPPLPAAMVPIAPPGGAHEFASRKQTEDEIIKAMRDEEVKVIGVCGMGGVGKTVTAKRIMNRAREKEGLFDEVLMVVVGQQSDSFKIQRDIADWLGMKFGEETLAPRANRLRDRLMSGKRKLIVIDDIWEMIDLESFGIPCGSGLCKILLTSRDRNVLNQMDAHMIFTVKELNEEEAWRMFKENAGVCVDDSKLYPIATEIVKKCNGLPLALVAVARALKGNLSEPIWKDALKQLRSGNPIDLPPVIKEVYNPIKLSYNFLENQHAKSLLFLCSFLPEDYEIRLQYNLLYYSFGLGIFDEINNLEEARNRIATLMEMLKSRFLILDGIDEHHVKMHDVVRDVVIFIASEEKHAILQSSTMDCWSRQNPHLENCTMLSVFLKERMIELPMELSFPTLHFLWMDDPRFREFQLSGYFFKDMQQLKVLYMHSFSFGLTPQTMQPLKNLRTLHLYYCMSLEVLSAVGELSSLEIFVCRGCHSISELPMEMGRLKRLMLLDVSNCSSLKTIIPGVISNLVRLEELKMLRSFKKWESDKKGNNRSNASLTELESLCNLKCLEIEIEDWSLAKEKLEFSSEIENYTIFVGKNRSRRYPAHHYEKRLTLTFPMENLLSLGNWIHTFARGAKNLSLEGGASHILDFASNTRNTRWLSIDGCTAVKKLVVSPVLVRLRLTSLPNLEEILYDLRDINISECGKLSSLFSSSILIKNLHISDCGSMEEVFAIELEKKDYEKMTCITFSELKSLSLGNLQRLTTFSKGIHHGIINIEFPQLVELSIRNCPKLISFINIGTADQNHVNSSGAHHLFCNIAKQQITFRRLKVLTIGGYDNDAKYLWCHHIPHPFFAGLEELIIVDCVNIQNLFSYSIAENLVNLKILSIRGCNEMVYVIGDDITNTETTSETKPEILIFHKLERLELKCLPKLHCLSGGKREPEFPSHVCYAHHDYVHLFCNDKITLGGLKQLFIEGYNKDIKYLWCHHIPHSFYAGLEELYITDCCNIRNLFSYSISQNLFNLKRLEIKKCNEMVYVIADDIITETTSETMPQILIFHKLEAMYLWKLPKLQNFCESKCDLQFPSLRKVDIFEWGSLTAPTLEDSCSAHGDDGVFFNTKITFGSLKELTIREYKKDVKYLWCHDIPHPFFAVLESLDIFRCVNIQNLFSYSIAGNLVNLKRLNISRCNEMVYVIDDDITNTETTSEANPQILFRKLEKVFLRSLPKLQSFSTGKCDLQFPWLILVEISKCPRLEGFTMGSLSTPNMRKFKMDGQMKNVEDLIIYPRL